MLKHCCFAIALLLGAVCAVTRVGAGPTGPVFRVNTTTFHGETVPNIAPLKNGGFVIIWQSGNVGNIHGGRENTDLFGQLYSADGTPAGGEFKVNTYANSTQFDVSVVGLNDGGFVAAWTSFKQDGNGFAVAAQRFDATGARVGSEFTVNTHKGGDQGHPAVAALSNGGFVVMWNWTTTYPPQSSWKAGVYGQVYNASSARVGGEFRVTPDLTQEQVCPAVAGINGGGFVATWVVGVSARSDLYAQRYNSLGQKLGSAFKIDDNMTACHYGVGGDDDWGDTGRVMIAPLTVGGYVVVWQTPRNRNTGFGFTRAQRFSAAGVHVDNRIDVNTYNQSTSTPSETFVANLSDGGFIVTWNLGAVFARQYSASGAPVTDAFEIDPSANEIHSAAQAAKLKNGGYVLTWQSESASNPCDFPDCRIDILGQLFGP